MDLYESETQVQLLIYGVFKGKGLKEKKCEKWGMELLRRVIQSAAINHLNILTPR